MAGTCSLVASKTARAAASPALLSLRPAELVTSKLRQFVEPSGRAGMLGVAAAGVGAAVSASPLFPAGSCGLVLPGDRGGPIESDACFALTPGARWWSPSGLADRSSANGSRIFSLVALTLCPLTVF